jgi:hypothetical protein
MALDGEESNVVNPETGEKRPLKVTFKSRSCGNKCGYITYKIFRFYFVSFYFYFEPYVVFIVLFFVPMYWYNGQVIKT